MRCLSVFPTRPSKNLYFICFFIEFPRTVFQQDVHFSFKAIVTSPSKKCTRFSRFFGNLKYPPLSQQLTLGIGCSLNKKTQDSFEIDRAIVHTHHVFKALVPNGCLHNELESLVPNMCFQYVFKTLVPKGCFQYL